MKKERDAKTTNQRFLAAVMFTDIVGFTAMMQENEEGTLSKLSIYKALLEEHHHKHHGRIIQYYGDGALSVFQSAYHAVACAIDIQIALRSEDDLPVRIGIHLGDIVEKDASIFGDGVNIASRIESIAIPQSILLSEDVYRHLHNHPEFSFKALGSIRFKNVQYPIEVYALDQMDLQIPTGKQLEGKLSTRLKVKPVYANILMWAALCILSLGTIYTYFNAQKLVTLAESDGIATLGVVPFDMKRINGSQGELLFSSLSDDVISGLSSLDGMRVLNAEASQRLAESEKEEVLLSSANKMGLTHLLRGNLSTSRDSVTVDLALTDALTGKNTWQRQFVRPINELPDLQKDITSQIAERFDATPNPFLISDGLQEKYYANFRVRRLYKKAKAAANNRKSSGLRDAIAHLKQSVQLDSTFALGYAGLSHYYSLMKVYGYMDIDSAFFHANENVGTALKLDNKLAEAYSANALLNYTFFLSEADEILELCQQAIQLKPSYDYAYHLIGKVYFDQGEFEEAKYYFESAMKLDPYEYVYQKMYAASLEKMGDRIVAEEQYAMLEERFPENADVYSSQTAFYINAKNQKKAKNCLTKIKDPFDKSSAKFLMNNRDGHIKEALSNLEGIKKNYPNRQFHDLEVRYFDMQGNVDSILSVLNQAFAKKEGWLKELDNMGLSAKTLSNQEIKELLSQIKGK